MKNILKNIAIFFFSLVMIMATLLGCGHAENGSFGKALFYVAIEIIGCVIVFFIAHHNENVAKKMAIKKAIAYKRAMLRTEENLKAESRAKAYQDATFEFITSEDSPESSSCIDPLEELKINLLCQNAMSRYKKNISR